MNELRLTWEAVERIVEVWVDTETKPGVVIGIANGGLIPAKLVADQTGARMLILEATSYEGMDRGQLTIRVPCWIRDASLRESTAPIWVVDELIDSGATMRGVTDMLLAYGIDHVPHALVSKHCAGLAHRDAVVFPWDRFEAARIKQQRALRRLKRFGPKSVQRLIVERRV